MIKSMNEKRLRASYGTAKKLSRKTDLRQNKHKLSFLLLKCLDTQKRCNCASKTAIEDDVGKVKEQTEH